MEIQFLDFDEIIVMQGGVTITTNVATGEQFETLPPQEDVPWLLTEQAW